MRQSSVRAAYSLIENIYDYQSCKISDHILAYDYDYFGRPGTITITIEKNRN